MYIIYLVVRVLVAIVVPVIVHVVSNRPLGGL